MIDGYQIDLDYGYNANRQPVIRWECRDGKRLIDSGVSDSYRNALADITAAIEEDQMK